MSILAVSGFLALAIMAPNAVQLFKYVIKTPQQRKNHLYYIKLVVSKMAKQGFVRLEKKKLAKLWFVSQPKATKN